MNVLLISSLTHVRDWAREAAQDIDGRDWAVHEVRHVEACNALLRPRDDIDLVLLDLDAAGLGAIDVGRIRSTRLNIAVTRWLTTEADLVACVWGGALGNFPKELSAGALTFALSAVAQYALVSKFEASARARRRHLLIPTGSPVGSEKLISLREQAHQRRINAGSAITLVSSPRALEVSASPRRFFSLPEWPRHLPRVEGMRGARQETGGREVGGALTPDYRPGGALGAVWSRSPGEPACTS